MGTRSVVGLDLNDPETMGLARRLYWARFSNRVRAAGLDPEDGFQEVVLAILRRQGGRSAFDPKRATLAGYLYVAMTGITINLADAESRRRRREGGVTLSYWDGVGDTDDADASTPTDRRKPLHAQQPAVSVVEVQDLATAWGVPAVVVTTIAGGGDPVLAALAGGMPAREAVALGEALGVR